MRLRKALIHGALSALLASLAAAGGAEAKGGLEAKAKASVSLGVNAKAKAAGKPEATRAKAATAAKPERAKTRDTAKAQTKAATAGKSEQAKADGQRKAKGLSAGEPPPGKRGPRRDATEGKPGERRALGHEHAPGQAEKASDGEHPRERGKKLGHRKGHGHAESAEKAAQRWRYTELRKKELAGEKLNESERAELTALTERSDLWSQRVRDRLERRRELEQKQQGAKLDQREQKELEQIEALEKRHHELREKRRERHADRRERAEAARKEARGQVPEGSTDEDTRAGFAKNARRLARLECSREIAHAEGRDDLVARIDALQTKEKERHARWVASRKGSSK